MGCLKPPLDRSGWGRKGVDELAWDEFGIRGVPAVTHDDGILLRSTNGFLTVGPNGPGEVVLQGHDGKGDGRIDDVIGAIEDEVAGSDAVASPGGTSDDAVISGGGAISGGDAVAFIEGPVADEFCVGGSMEECSCGGEREK